MKRAHVSSLIALCTLPGAAFAGPVDFTAENPLANVTASAEINGLEDSGGGPFSGFDSLTFSTGASAVVDEYNLAQANVFIEATLEATRLQVSGNAGTDADSELGFSGFAEGIVGFVLTFEVTQSAAFTISGFAGGVHADAQITLSRAGAPDPIISTDDENFDGFQGELTPGFYEIAAQATSYTNLTDGYNGLFAGSNFFVELVVSPVPGDCPADLDGNGEADLGDFLAFFNAYDALLPLADLTGEGDVDFADFLEFFNSYDAGCAQ